MPLGLQGSQVSLIRTGSDPFGLKLRYRVRIVVNDSRCLERLILDARSRSYIESDYTEEEEQSNVFAFGSEADTVKEPSGTVELPSAFRTWHMKPLKSGVDELALSMVTVKEKRTKGRFTNDVRVTED